MSKNRSTAVLLSLVLAGAWAAPSKAQPSAAVPKVATASGNPAVGKLLPAVQIAMPNFAMVPGETRAIHAMMTSAGSPVPNGKVTFFIDGNQIGHATTDGAGKASFDFKLPNTAPGSHGMLAKFDGDKSYHAGQAKSNLLVATALTETKIEFTTVANEGGSSPALPIFILHVTRKSDNKKMDVFLDVKVNGAVFKNVPGQNPKTEAPNVFKSNKGPWKVEAQYNGDAYTQSSNATATHP